MSKGGYEFELVRRLISADAGNILRIGSDDKLFVGPPTNLDANTPAGNVDAEG